MARGAEGARATKSDKGDHGLNRAIWLVGGLLALVVVGFGGYYYYDRYMHQNVPLLQQDQSHYQELIMKDPQNAGARVALADTYMSQSQYDQAIAQYREALKIQPKHVGAQVGLGVALYKTGDHDGALDTFQKLIAQYTDPDVASSASELTEVHYYMGLIYADKNELDKAEKEFKTVLAVNRTDADAIYQEGLIYLRQKDYVAAVGAFQAAVDLVPDFKEAYEGLADAYSQEGKNAEAKYAQGMVDYCNKSYDAAASKLEDAVKQKADLTEGWVGLGLIYDKLGQKDKAIKAYQEAVKLDPNQLVANSELTRLGGERPNPTPQLTPSASSTQS